MLLAMNQTINPKRIRPRSDIAAQSENFLPPSRQQNSSAGRCNTDEPDPRLWLTVSRQRCPGLSHHVLIWPTTVIVREAPMATDLVSEIVEAVGPTIVSRVASSLGFDQAVTQKAINAAVPGLLAALISLVSKPQGASRLADAVRS